MNDAPKNGAHFDISLLVRPCVGQAENLVDTLSGRDLDVGPPERLIGQGQIDKAAPGVDASTNASRIVSWSPSGLSLHIFLSVRVG